MSSLLRHLIKQQGVLVLWSHYSSEEECCPRPVHAAMLAVPLRYMVTHGNIWAPVYMTVDGWNQ